MKIQSRKRNNTYQHQLSNKSNQSQHHATVSFQKNQSKLDRSRTSNSYIDDIVAQTNQKLYLRESEQQQDIPQNADDLKYPNERKTQIHTRKNHLSNKHNTGKQFNKSEQRTNKFKQYPYVNNHSGKFSNQYPNISNYIEKINQIHLPQSYLLAMQSMQNKIKQLEDELHQLHAKLIEQEKQKLYSQERINQVLNKFKSLAQEKQQLMIQNRQLKLQVKQLRNKILKSKSTEKIVPHSQQKITSIAKIKIQNEANEKKKQSQLNTENLKQLLISKQFNQKVNKNTLQDKKNVQKINHQSKILSDKRSISNFSNFQSTNQISSQIKISDRNYISYYRQIIRYQKQLVSLQYRQQCLERKISSHQSTNSQQYKQLKLKLQKTSLQIKQLDQKINKMKQDENKKISNLNFYS